MTDSKLRITGITEDITWYKPDDGSDPSWSAAVGIEGLKPALAPGGYAHKYIRELISPEGKVVNTGMLSQDPESNTSSTSVAIGGKGLPAGDYIVKISGGDEEDSMQIHVPDITEPVQKIQSPKKLRNVLKRIVASNDNRLQHVETLVLEEENTDLFLGIQRTDGSKYSVILRGGHPNSYKASENELRRINMILDNLGGKLLDFAESYMKDDRKEVEFLHDIVALSKDISKLSSQANHLISIGAASDLMHNRIVAQLLAIYKDMGCSVNERPTADVNGGPVHDFNIEGLKCDVKTIQSIGDLEYVATGGLRLTSKSNSSLSSRIYDDVHKAIGQVGDKGMIFIAPWSYRINGLLRSYFSDKLLLYPPPPTPGLTVLILTSEKAFEDYYIAFQTERVTSEMQQVLEKIQLTGVTQVGMIPIRKGLTMRASTASRPGSSAGFFFKMAG